jgi:hypothetical protein
MNQRQCSLPALSLEEPGDLARYVAGGFRRKEKYYRATLPSGREIGLGITTGDDWIDVIVRRRRSGESGNIATGTFATFGFHAVEGRWRYGTSPPGSSEIRNFLAAHLGTPIKVPRHRLR